jgi:hypothetical protein
MTAWDTNIANAFTSRYADARSRAARSGGADGDSEGNTVTALRLRSVNIFPQL